MWKLEFSLREVTSSIFDEKGADEQSSLLTSAEKCASGVDSEVAARTGNGASRRLCLMCVPGLRPPPDAI